MYCLAADCCGRFTFIGGRPFFISIFRRKEIHMELNEMEKHLIFQTEGYGKQRTFTGKHDSNAFCGYVYQAGKSTG